MNTSKSKPESKPESKSATPAPEHRRRVPMTYPGAATVKAHQAGTKRALVVEMLTSPEGATFDEVREAVNARFPDGTKGREWDVRTTMEGIKLISGGATQGLGYRLIEDPATGKIRATRDEGRKAG